MEAATANSAPCSAPAALLPPHALFNRPLPLSAGHCPCAATRLDPGAIDGADPNESRCNGSGHVIEAPAHPAAPRTVSTGCVGLLLTALSWPSLFLPPLVLLADWTASGPGGPLLPTASRTTCFATCGSTRRLAAARHGPCCQARCVRPAFAYVSCRPQRSARRPVPVRPNEPLVHVHPHQMQEVVRGTRSAHGTARRCHPPLSHLHAHDIAHRALSLARTFIPPVVRRSTPAIRTAAALCHVSRHRNPDVLVRCAALALVCSRCLLSSRQRFM